ncbi:RNA-binding domain-containing protein [Pseudolysinimonas sp.]|jgi:ATP-dependent DNA helicase RecG|uniref:RNA-binding domain-containing protein n=1 Tax=Pseudolysinimonas sp. TaxID=2680009 RepID=UPI003782F9E5
MRTKEALQRILDGSTAHDLETERLDFKRESHSRDDTARDIADAAVCFANGQGGIVVLGVADKVAGSDALLGTEMEPSALRQRIYELTEPPLDVVARVLRFEEARLLEIVVQEGLDVYQVRGKVPTRRFEAQCLQMTPSDVSRLHEDRRGSDWSAVDSGRPSTDIEPGAELLLRSLVRGAPAAPRDVNQMSTVDLLRSMSLCLDNGNLNRAGEIMLCAPRGGEELLVYQYRESAGGEVRAGRRWTTPLLVAFVEARAMIEARIDSTPVNLPSGQQIQIQDYPQAAIREALANALMHGDHRERRPVYIEHSPELLTVRSPGPLVAGISPTNILTHPPKARFPALAEAMRACGLAEKWGQGVDRMYREMIRSGRAAPTVEVVEGREPETSVRFMGGPPNARIAKFIATLPESEQEDTDALLVVATLASRRTINAEQLSSVVQRDAETAQAVLARLSQGVAELVEPTPRSVGRRHPDYRLRAAAIAALGPALSYQSRPKADSDRKVYAHVREYGSINNAAVQRMFDVDVYAARDLLRDLVGREVLMRISEQARGPGVKYGAGPKFPSRKGESRPLPPSPTVPLITLQELDFGPIE